MRLGKRGRGWISVEGVVKVGEHSLLNYLKSAEDKSDRELDVFVTEKRETITYY